MLPNSRPYLIDRSASLVGARALPPGIGTGRRAFLTAVMALAAMVSASGCGSDTAAPEELTPNARPVRVVEAELVNAPARQRFPGALRARNRAELAFLHPGTLAERPVRLGQRVAAGELLAVLHNPALQPGVAAAEGRVLEARTRLQQLELDVQRQATLLERRLISEDALDQTRTSRDAARATLDQAEAALDEARNQLEDAELRAPFAGVVARFLVEPGDFAAAGQPVVELVDPAELEVEIALPAEIAPENIGAIRVLHPRHGLQASGRLAQIGQAGPGMPRPVRIDVVTNASTDLDRRWQSGDAVQIELDLEAAPALMVPLASLSDPGTGFARLFRVRDGRAEQVAVLTGRLDGDRISVTGGLEPGDAVVVAGQAHLLDGEAVQVLP